MKSVRDVQKILQDLVFQLQQSQEDMGIDLGGISAAVEDFIRSMEKFQNEEA